MITFVIVLSLILDNALSLISGNFILLFTLISLIIIYPYFNNKDTNYFKTALIIGLIYDVILTNTLFLNMGIFLLIAIFITRLNLALSNNHINILIMSFLVIVFYQIILLLTLSFINYIPFNMSSLVEVSINALPLNLIYAFFMYLTTDYFSKKYHIAKID